MNIVELLLLREDIDALQHDLAKERRAQQPERARMQQLQDEIERLERRYAAIRDRRASQQVAY